MEEVEARIGSRAEVTSLDTSQSPVSKKGGTDEAYNPLPILPEEDCALRKRRGPLTTDEAHGVQILRIQSVKGSWSSAKVTGTQIMVALIGLLEPAPHKLANVFSSFLE